MNGFKLKERRFRLDVRWKFLTQRLGKSCKRLPREAVDAPSLKAFKAKLVEAQDSPIPWDIYLPTARRFKQDGL